jgi:hypothetical protein
VPAPEVNFATIPINPRRPAIAFARSLWPWKVKRKTIAMLYDLEILDPIKDRIVVLGHNPVEVVEECVDRDALWHFLLDGNPVSLICSVPRGEPSQENEWAKEFLARDLYIKDPANRTIVKARICNEHVFETRMTIDVSVPKGASDEEIWHLANKAALDIEEPFKYPNEDYDLVDMDQTVEAIDGREVSIQESPCLCCFVRKIASRDIVPSGNQDDCPDLSFKMNELIIEARELLGIV